MIGGAHPILVLVAKLSQADCPAGVPPSWPGPPERLPLPEPSRPSDKVILRLCHLCDVVQRVARAARGGEERLGGKEGERGREGVGEEDVGGGRWRRGEGGFALRRGREG